MLTPSEMPKKEPIRVILPPDQFSEVMAQRRHGKILFESGSVVFWLNRYVKNADFRIPHFHALRSA